MNLKKLLVPLGLALLLIVSWLSPWSRPYWDLLDRYAFFALNSWVQKSLFWQNFWAFSGSSNMDWISDGVMALFFILPLKGATAAQKKRKVAELIFSTLLVFTTTQIINIALFHRLIQFSRKSPTLIYEGAFRLSHAIGSILVKDHSSTSFPSDHATTALLFATIIYHLVGYRLKSLLAIFYALFLCLPRLIAGAHWISDVLIGSLSIALVISSSVFATPFADYCIRGLQNLLFKQGFKKEKYGKKEPKKEGKES